MKEFQISNFKFSISNKFSSYKLENVFIRVLEIRNWKLQIGNSCLWQAGFTMIEFVVYIGIFIVLVGILTGVFTSILDNQLTTESTSSIDENQHYMLSRLTYDINRSQSIITPASPGLQTSNLQLQINNINYSYSLDSNGNFQLKDITDNLGPYNLNDYDASISAVQFTRIGNVGGKNTIQVAFTITSKTLQRGKTQSKSFATTIGTR